MKSVTRRVVAILVLTGLLLQAFAVVRHASMSVSAKLATLAALPTQNTAASDAELALAADLAAAICLNDGSGSMQAMPAHGPSQSDMSECPICNGTASAYALVPPLALVARAILSDTVVVFAPFDQRVARHAFLRPQSRGPPALG